MSEHHGIELQNHLEDNDTKFDKVPSTEYKGMQHSAEILNCIPLKRSTDHAAEECISVLITS